MARTAVEEMWGGYHAQGVGSISKLPLPSGVPGAARFIELKDTGCKLQDARLLQVGGPVYTIWNNQVGGGTGTIQTAAGVTLATVANDSVTQCYLIDNATEAGTWQLRTSAAVNSAAQTITIDEFTFELGAGVSLGVNIRTLCDQEGYSGTNPARVNVTIGPQNSATSGVVGGSTAGGEAMDTGTFPAGSIILLTVLPNGYISGRGGTGGTGQPITGGTPSSPTTGSVVNGTNGGDGLHVRCNTVLYNYGRIQGGGGGGSGGGAVGAISGPGGGGGAGYWSSPIGQAGSFPTASGFGGGGNGQRGRLNQAGLGGGVNNGAPAGTGGAGGDPGQAGNDSSDTAGGFGQPGFAIKVLSGVTLTKAVAGNIDGAEGVL